MISKIFKFISVLLFLSISSERVSSQLSGVTLPPWITLPPNINLPGNILPDDYMLIHQALITRKGSTDLNQFICGGSIVMNFTILTSANCLLNSNGDFFNASDLSVVLGLYSIQNNIPPEPTTFDVQDIIVHRRYNRRTQANNVALLRLGRSVSIGATISPTAPSTNRINSSMQCNLLAFSNNQPKAISITPRIHSACTARDQDESWPLETFCSGGSEFDTCQATRGSALICGGLLQGIVTRSCNSDHIMQYTDVSQFFFWTAVNQFDENPYRLMDNEIVRYLLFSVLDFIAWVVGTPGIADKFELVKFFF